MEDDTERGYMEELKKDYGIDLTRQSKSEGKSAKPEDVADVKREEMGPSQSAVPEDQMKLNINFTSEERKKFLLDRHEKLTIENENLKKELEEIKLRIQSFRTTDRQQEQTSDE